MSPFSQDFDVISKKKVFSFLSVISLGPLKPMGPLLGLLKPTGPIIGPHDGPPDAHGPREAHRPPKVHEPRGHCPPLPPPLVGPATYSNQAKRDLFLCFPRIFNFVPRTFNTLATDFPRQ